MYYIFKTETGTFEGYPICRWRKYWYSDSKTEIRNAYFELVNKYKANKAEILVVKEVDIENENFRTC